MLANAFCQSTREDFKGILQQSARRQDGQTLDVNLLLSCLQETLDFEHGLENRFARDVRYSRPVMQHRLTPVSLVRQSTQSARPKKDLQRSNRRYLKHLSLT